LKWSLIKSNNVKIFTSSTTKLKENDEFFNSLTHDKAMVLICTYSMLSYSGDRAEKTKLVMDFIKSHEWGLMLLDEV
jgi:DNA excision repair protein ERCC-3